MKVKDLLKLEIEIDIYDDYDERCGVAFCGPCNLTAKGKKKFASILGNSVDFWLYPEEDMAVVHCDNEYDAQMAKYLFHGFAGFIPSDEWDEYFIEL